MRVLLSTDRSLWSSLTVTPTGSGGTANLRRFPVSTGWSGTGSSVVFKFDMASSVRLRSFALAGLSTPGARWEIHRSTSASGTAAGSVIEAPNQGVVIGEIPVRPTAAQFNWSIKGVNPGGGSRNWTVGYIVVSEMLLREIPPISKMMRTRRVVQLAQSGQSGSPILGQVQNRRWAGEWSWVTRSVADRNQLTEFLGLLEDRGRVAFVEPVVDGGDTMAVRLDETLWREDFSRGTGAVRNISARWVSDPLPQMRNS